MKIQFSAVVGVLWASNSFLGVPSAAPFDDPHPDMPAVVCDYYAGAEPSTTEIDGDPYTCRVCHHGSACSTICESADGTGQTYCLDGDEWVDLDAPLSYWDMLFADLEAIFSDFLDDIF